MKRFIVSLGILFLVACHGKGVKNLTPPEDLQLNALGVPSAVIYRQYKDLFVAGTALPSSTEEENQGYVGRIKKQQGVVLAKGLISPKGLSYDMRRAHLYVADRDHVKIYKVKKSVLDTIVVTPSLEPGQEPPVFESVSF